MRTMNIHATNVPRGYDGCQCYCHRMPGVVHCIPCCGPGRRAVGNFHVSPPDNRTSIERIEDEGSQEAFVESVLTPKVQVDVDHVLHLKEELRRLNRIDFDSIEWVKDGKPVEMTPTRKKMKEEWSRYGFNNCDFADFFIAESFVDFFKDNK